MTEQSIPIQIGAIKPVKINEEDVDFQVPTIKVRFLDRDYEEVLVDGGSGVNILPEAVYREIGAPKLEAAPF